MKKFTGHTDHSIKTVLTDRTTGVSMTDKNMTKELNRNATTPTFLGGLFRQYDPMREQELEDSYAAQSEMLEGLREIYRMRGEDELIADICNRLIERYGRSL